jgi:hypothetical protein
VVLLYGGVKSDERFSCICLRYRGVTEISGECHVVCVSSGKCFLIVSVISVECYVVYCSSRNVVPLVTVISGKKCIVFFSKASILVKKIQTIFKTLFVLEILAHPRWTMVWRLFWRKVWASHCKDGVYL